MTTKLDAVAPVVGVSPVVGGAPVRGMADACLTAIGVETSAAAVARHYGRRADGGVLDAWLVDTADAGAVPGLRTALATTRAPVVAVSPLIGGRAVKGPTAKMMAELGLPVTARAVAEHYAGLLDLFVADPDDAAALAGIDARVVAAPTLMRSLADKQALARTVLAAAGIPADAALPRTGG